MRVLLAAALAAVTIAAGCGNDVDDAGSEWPRRDLKIMAPADPGGGWDTTAREMAHVIEDSDVIPKNVEIYNVTGAGGTLLVSDGDWSALVERPFAAAVLVVGLLAFAIPLLPRLIARLRGERFEGRRMTFGDED